MIMNLVAFENCLHGIFGASFFLPGCSRSTVPDASRTKIRNLVSFILPPAKRSRPSKNDDVNRLFFVLISGTTNSITTNRSSLISKRSPAQGENSPVFPPSFRRIPAIGCVSLPLGWRSAKSLPFARSARQAPAEQSSCR